MIFLSFWLIQNPNSVRIPESSSGQALDAPSAYQDDNVTMKKVVLKLSGMRCTSCSVLIDTVLEELEGVKSAKTSYAEQKVEVEFDPSQVQLEKMLAAIKSEGYEANL